MGILHFIMGILHPSVQVLCVFCSPVMLWRLREGKVHAWDEDGGRREGHLSVRILSGF